MNNVPVKKRSSNNTSFSKFVQLDFGRTVNLNLNKFRNEIGNNEFHVVNSRGRELSRHSFPFRMFPRRAIFAFLCQLIISYAAFESCNNDGIKSPSETRRLNWIWTSLIVNYIHDCRLQRSAPRRIYTFPSISRLQPRSQRIINNLFVPRKVTQFHNEPDCPSLRPLRRSGNRKIFAGEVTLYVYSLIISDEIIFNSKLLCSIKFAYNWPNLDRDIFTPHSF